MSCCDHDDCCAPQTDSRYRVILWVALAVNLTMFGVELATSIIAGSVSLRADALDFLADAANYTVALAVVGLALHWRARAALLKGGVMGLFGLWIAASTVHHALTGTVPRAEVMGGIGLLALAANLAIADWAGSVITVSSRVVDVVMGAELLRQFRLVGATGNRRDLEPHVPGILHTQMTKAADTDHSDKITRLRRGVSERAERREPRAQERRRIDRR